MNKQGISTAKGFFAIVPFAKQLFGEKTSLAKKTVTMGETAISLALEKNCTYLFELHFSALGYYHTAILTVPDDDAGVAESTAFVYRYVTGTSVETPVMTLVYNVANKKLTFSADRSIAESGKTTDVTMKYAKIMAGV